MHPNSAEEHDASLRCVHGQQVRIPKCPSQNGAERRASCGSESKESLQHSLQALLLLSVHHGGSEC